MWSLFETRVTKPEGICSVGFTSKGIACVYLISGPNKTEIKSYHFLPCIHKDDWEEVLRSHVERHNLYGADCICVLQPHDYRIIVIDAPQVSVAEYKDAARWAVMDFVDFPLEESAIEIFNASEAKPGEAQKIFVVVTRKSLLKHIDSTIQQAGLKLYRIDITELALCNIVEHLYQNESVALLFSGEQGEHLIIEKDKLLYFERSFDRIQAGETGEQYVLPQAEETGEVTAGSEAVKDDQEKTAQAISEDSSEDAGDAEEYLVVEVNDSAGLEETQIDQIEKPIDKIESLEFEKTEEKKEAEGLIPQKEPTNAESENLESDKLEEKEEQLTLEQSEEARNASTESDDVAIDKTGQVTHEDVAIAQQKSASLLAERLAQKANNKKENSNRPYQKKKWKAPK